MTDIVMEHHANVYRYVRNSPIMHTDPVGLARKRVPNRTRNCNPAEFQACEQQCGSRGVESCKVSQTFRITRVTKDGLAKYEWVDGPMSCSCNDPEDDNPI